MAEQIFVALYTDADVTPKLARLLQERGFDAISTQEMGKFESPDVEQLVYAAGQGRAILTYNRRTSSLSTRNGGGRAMTTSASSFPSNCQLENCSIGSFGC